MTGTVRFISVWDPLSDYAPVLSAESPGRVCVVGCSIVRYVGMMTIIMNDYPWVKFALIGGMGLFVLTSREGV